MFLLYATISVAHVSTVEFRKDTVRRLFNENDRVNAVGIGTSVKLPFAQMVYDGHHALTANTDELNLL
jgi:hypothetical protein